MPSTLPYKLRPLPAYNEAAALTELAEDMIPKIPYLSGAALEARRAQRNAVKEYLTIGTLGGNTGCEG
jgi:hypothetical protein